MKFRKKPVVIEAIQWKGNNSEELIGWANTFANPGEPFNWSFTTDTRRVRIPTLEGDMMADKGDWIIRGIKGEFYTCKPDIFEATYVEDTQ